MNRSREIALLVLPNELLLRTFAYLPWWVVDLLSRSADQFISVAAHHVRQRYITVGLPAAELDALDMQLTWTGLSRLLRSPFSCFDTSTPVRRARVHLNHSLDLDLYTTYFPGGTHPVVPVLRVELVVLQEIWALVESKYHGTTNPMVFAALSITPSSNTFSVFVDQMGGVSSALTLFSYSRCRVPVMHRDALAHLQLPPGLQTLCLSHVNLHGVEELCAFPPGLVEIDLLGTQIGDLALLAALFPLSVRLLSLLDTPVRLLGGIAFPPRLERLMLARCYVVDFGCGFLYLSELRTLAVSLCIPALSSISDDFIPQGVVELNITFIPPQTSPDGHDPRVLEGFLQQAALFIMAPLRALRVLRMEGTMPSLDQMEFPPTLQTLEIHGMGLERLPRLLYLAQLEVLNANNNLLTTGEGDFPPSLLVLHMGGNQLRQIPALWPQQLPRLQELVVYNNNRLNLFAMGTHNIPLQVRLIMLCLSTCGLVSRPQPGMVLADFRHLVCLESLSLVDCNISDLGVFGFPECLRRLDLRHNLLEDTAEFRFPSQLRELSFRETSPEAIFGSVLPSLLASLDLSECGIRHFSPQFAFPRQLRLLNLSHNELTSLVECSLPTHLHHLDLLYNQIWDLWDLASSLHAQQAWSRVVIPPSVGWLCLEHNRLDTNVDVAYRIWGHAINLLQPVLTAGNRSHTNGPETVDWI